jgi:hypothetical protein
MSKKDDGDRVEGGKDAKLRRRKQLKMAHREKNDAFERKKMAKKIEEKLQDPMKKSNEQIERYFVKFETLKKFWKIFLIVVYQVLIFVHWNPHCLTNHSGCFLIVVQITQAAFSLSYTI